VAALSSPATDAGLVTMIQALSGKARSDLYTSMSLATKTDFYLAMPPEYRVKLFTYMTPAEQKAVYNALLPDYRCNLYNSLSDTEIQKLLSWLEPDKRAELDGYAHAHNRPDAPQLPVTYGLRTELHQKLTKDTYLTDFYSMISSGSIMDLYYRLSPENRSLVLSHDARIELDHGLAGAALNNVAVHAELEQVLKKAVAQQFANTLPPDAGADFMNQFDKASIIQLRNIVVNPVTNFTLDRMLNSTSGSYEQYRPFERPEEVMQNILGCHFAGILDGKLPKTEAMQPLHEYIERLDSAVVDATAYINAKKQEAIKARSAAVTQL
jgi:hypothetical protein